MKNSQQILITIGFLRWFFQLGYHYLLIYKLLFYFIYFLKKDNDSGLI